MKRWWQMFRRYCASFRKTSRFNWHENLNELSINQSISKPIISWGGMVNSYLLEKGFGFIEKLSLIVNNESTYTSHKTRSIVCITQLNWIHIVWNEARKLCFRINFFSMVTTLEIFQSYISVKPGINFPSNRSKPDHKKLS